MIKWLICWLESHCFQTTHDHVMGWRVGPRDPMSKAFLLSFTRSVNIQNFKV